MRIIFLHLSDLHLKNAEGANPIKIQAAVQSLSVLGRFDGAVIIISGDIAATGSGNEYKIAAIFLGRFIDEIKKKYNISTKNMKILLVPGNHDIDYGGEIRPLPEVIRKYTIEERINNLFHEINRMHNFFYFTNGNGCFFSEKMSGNMKYAQLVTRKMLF